MNSSDGVNAADLTEQRGVVRASKKAKDEERKQTAGNLQGYTYAGSHPRNRHDESQEPSSDENVHDAVISKYRGRGVFITSCILVLVAAGVLLIDRSRLSGWWIALVVAAAAFFVFIQSKNISHSYIAEAQRIMQKEVSDCERGSPLTRALLIPASLCT